MSQLTTDAVYSQQLKLLPEDNERLTQLCGPYNQHLKLISDAAGVKINHRGHSFEIVGDKSQVMQAVKVLKALYKEINTGEELSPDQVHLALRSVACKNNHHHQDGEPINVIIETPLLKIKPRGINQQKYVSNVFDNDINFGIGPAGTGKTYLAVACAVNALMREDVRRIVLVRPAVEAGENLGFLPGDLVQKVDPYLRPLYDALYDMLGNEQVAKLIEKDVIEVAPLAFMRGRTLNDAFIILDEGQNTSVEQMKMFLTRIGFGSKAVITGDVTQIDLPRGKLSGLRHVLEVLDGLKGICFNHFEACDVVRHNLVQRIIEAYHESEKEGNNGRTNP